MSRCKTCLVACAIALFASPSFAGVLATDTSSYLGVWNGSTPFQAYDLFNQPTGLTGYVDWAVYGPGDFPAGFLGYVPTPGELTYTYQIFSTGSAPVTSLSVNLINPANNIGTFSGAGVAGAPTIIDLLVPFDSANWFFTGFGPGSSVGLVFSSPRIPIPLNGSVIDDGSVAAVIPIPSPGPFTIPEPSTVTMALVGVVGLALAWIRKNGLRVWRR